MFLTRPVVFVAGSASLLIACRSHAQCTPDWVPGAAYPGLDGFAGDAVLWDPDGPGPEPEMLVITGEFDTVGGVAARNVAAWDGTQWRALGAGFGGRSSSDSFGGFTRWHYPLGVHNGELYAGVSVVSCYFRRCGYSMGLLRWDGATWQQILGEGGVGAARSISALCTFQGELVVAGSFPSIQGVPARNIARWNGTEWRSLGTSPGDGIDGTASTLLVHDGRLIVAGYFDSAGGVAARNIASWDGAEWRPLGAGLGGEYVGGEYGVSTLAVYHQELVAAGSFNAASGDPENIARWDGTQWQPLNTGIGGVDVSYISSLEVYADELIAGGNFDEAGGVPVRGAASWNGAEWRPWGAGMEFVTAFGACQGSLLAGGLFSTAGGPLHITIGRWDGVSWHFFGDGLTAPITALTSHNHELIGATMWQAASCNARMPAIISRWDGQCWIPLESRPPDEHAAIAAMTTYGSDLVVAGAFNSMDGVPATNIARWDGVHWHALGVGLGEPNSFDPSVRALTVYNGQLIAGGSFRTTGGAPAELVASWDGTHWQPMGAGFPNSFWTPHVFALAVHDGALFAGGTFDLGGVRAGVARWNPNSQVWEPILLSEQVNDWIFALASYGDDLIAAGWVQGKGSAFLPFIGRWDGSAWHSLGDIGADPASEYASVQTLAVVGPDLIVGGTFMMAGGTPVSNIARWDGTQWHAMGLGVTQGFIDSYYYGLYLPDVYALTAHDGTLAVGGNFLRVGDHASAFFAQWRCPQCPVDFNADSTVDSQDFFDFLGAFFAGDPAADFNHDGLTNAQDFFDFLAAFFEGC